MAVNAIGDVEFGAELPAFSPDTTLASVQDFCQVAGWDGPRFNSHEEARKLGLPGAIVPGIMSQGFLAAMIHRWAPEGQIVKIDTIFRAPVLVDHPHNITGTVTDINEAEHTVEIDLTVTNEAGETRVFGTASVRLH